MQQPRFSLWSRNLVLAALLALLLFAAGCEWSSLLDDDENDDDIDDNTPPATETNVPGLSVAVSDSEFDTTLADVRNASGNRANTETIATVDHQANANSVNRDLRPTTVILFDAPNRSAPLIAADPRVALDLPTRVLIYRDGTGASDNDNNGFGAGTGSDTANGNVAVAYTNTAYLDARYDLDDAEDGTLDALADDLQAIASEATGDNPSNGAASGVSDGEGIESVTGDNDFTTTLNQLTAAINARDNLTLMETVDFQARGVSRGLNPSTLFIFGNPEVGTQFMRATQTAGVDLPQKMLVAADDSGTVTIYYNDPDYIADRHDIDNREEQVDAVAMLLADLATEAGGTGTAPGGVTGSDGSMGSSGTTNATSTESAPVP